MSIQLAIFDLDGTLIDSRQDLANAVNATRAHMGLGALDNQRVYSYVGNGAPELIRRSLAKAAGDAEIPIALKFFLGYYRATSWTAPRFSPVFRNRSNACTRRASAWRC